MDETKPAGPADPGSDLTLPLAPGEAPKPVPPDRFIPPKYQSGILLGQGGMGEVFKAFDPTLGRFVALKFLRRDDPELVDRFLREARSQARVEHDLVCRVYEVGDAGGRPYIAMQYIEGETLDRAALRMTLEERVKAMKDVAEAIQAAHKIGLIHRDLKPGNIIVERTEDGRWKPHVMDFGLARELESQGTTETGAVMGTPAYMAPEQARGDVRSLDRRTDVYGLGAILYELLTGQPPFAAEGTLEILIRVTQHDPVPARKLNPAVPADLETVAMKCLEKEPQRRYESARALAEDLGRYLQGEPVLARRAGLARRLVMKGRKHRAVVATAAVFSALLLAATGLWLRSRWTASERALSAQRFGSQVERIEGILREGYLLPLHDTRREKGLVRQRMDAIRAEMKRLGGLAAGPGHYALGRGHLALHEYENARRELEAAWNAGEKAPEVSLALGEVLGALYQQSLEEARRLGSRELQEERLKEIGRSYREPALASLRRGGAETGAAGAYVEGLIALYEKRFPAALERAGLASSRDPGFYEARKLEGDTYLLRSAEEQLGGGDEAALQDLSKAGEAYGAALEIARSDSSLHIAEAERLLQAGMMEMLRGASPRKTFEAALAAAARGAAADSSSAEAHNTASEICWRWADFQLPRGEDPSDNLRRAEAEARSAVALDPSSAAGQRNLGEAAIGRAQLEMSRGADPAGSLSAATQALEKAASLAPGNSAVWGNLGVSYCLKAQVEDDRGQDPRPSLDRGIAGFQKSVAINPRLWSAYSNMGNAYDMKRNYESDHGLDARASIARAVDCYKRSLELNPRRASALNNLGVAYQGQAQDELERGADPGPLLKLAREHLERAMELNASDSLAAGDLGLVFSTGAEYNLAAGRDPRPDLEKSRASFEQALAIDPKLAPVRAYLADLERLGAEHDLASGRDPGPALGRARREAASALRLQPGDFEALLARAKVEVLGARAAVSRGRSAAAALAAAQEACEAARMANPASAQAWLEQAELDRWKAEALLAQKRDPSAAIDSGLAAAGKALERHPKMPPALAVRGSLELIRAQAASEIAVRREAASRSRDSLEQALAGNPLLARDYAATLERAKGLAAEVTSGR